MLQHRQQKNCCCQLPTHTHTHMHPFNGPLSGTTRVNRYQKGKTSLDFTEARDSEWQWHPLGHMQVCTSLQTDNHASTPPLSFYRPDALPVAQRTVSKHWRHCQLPNKAENINYLPDIPYIFKKAWRYSIYIVSQKKRPPFYFLNNSVKNQPILMIFGTLNPEKNSDKNLTDLSTSPVRCSHFTSANPKKVIFISIIHTYF